jgi:hypothetical protein
MIGVALRMPKRRNPILITGDDYIVSLTISTRSISLGTKLMFLMNDAYLSDLGSKGVFGVLMVLFRSTRLHLQYIFVSFL